MVLDYEVYAPVDGNSEKFTLFIRGLDCFFEYHEFIRALKESTFTKMLASGEVASKHYKKIIWDEIKALTKVQHCLYDVPPIVLWDSIAPLYKKYCALRKSHKKKPPFFYMAELKKSIFYSCDLMIMRERSFSLTHDFLQVGSYFWEIPSLSHAIRALVEGREAHIERKCKVRALHFMNITEPCVAKDFADRYSTEAEVGTIVLTMELVLDE